MIYFVYMIRCKDDSLYTGITNNISKRWEQHRKGTASKYTKARGPVSIEYIETMKNKSEAMKKECFIKKKTKRFKENLIKEMKMNEMEIEKELERLDKELSEAQEVEKYQTQQ